MKKITMYWKPENAKYGLIQGRHSLLVNTYIFDRIDDPTNINKMAAVAMNWASTLPKGEDIEIYVTGLTVAVIEVLNALTFEGVGAVLEEAGKMAGVEVYTTPGQYTDEVYFEIDGVNVFGRVEKQLKNEIA